MRRIGRRRGDSSGAITRQEGGEAFWGCCQSPEKRNGVKLISIQMHSSFCGIDPTTFPERANVLTLYIRIEVEL